jgi:hypothetical protein
VNLPVRAEPYDNASCSRRGELREADQNLREAEASELAAGLIERLGHTHLGPHWLTGGGAHTLHPPLAPGWQVEAVWC